MSVKVVNVVFVIYLGNFKFIRSLLIQTMFRLSTSDLSNGLEYSTALLHLVRPSRVWSGHFNNDNKENSFHRIMLNSFAIFLGLLKKFKSKFDRM